MLEDVCFAFKFHQNTRVGEPDGPYRHVWRKAVAMQDGSGINRDGNRQRLLFSERTFDGMVLEHCSSTSNESRRWQKAVQLTLCSDTHVVGSQGSCCRHRGIPF